jgi:hypothetical protein
MRSTFGITNTSYNERRLWIIYPSCLFFSSARMPSTNTLYGLGPCQHALVSLIVQSGGGVARRITKKVNNSLRVPTLQVRFGRQKHVDSTINVERQEIHPPHRYSELWTFNRLTHLPRRGRNNVIWVVMWCFSWFLSVPVTSKDITS